MEKRGDALHSCAFVRVATALYTKTTSLIQRANALLAHHYPLELLKRGEKIRQIHEKELAISTMSVQVNKMSRALSTNCVFRYQASLDELPEIKALEREFPPASNHSPHHRAAADGQILRILLHLAECISHLSEYGEVLSQKSNPVIGISGDQLHLHLAEPYKPNQPTNPPSIIVHVQTAVSTYRQGLEKGLYPEQKIVSHIASFLLELFVTC